MGWDLLNGILGCVCIVGDVSCEMLIADLGGTNWSLKGCLAMNFVFATFGKVKMGCGFEMGRVICGKRMKVKDKVEVMCLLLFHTF